MEVWIARIRTSSRKIAQARSWWIVFGVGIALGATVFGMKAALQEGVKPEAEQTAASREELSKLWSGAVEIPYVRRMTYEQSPVSQPTREQQGQSPAGSANEPAKPPEETAQKPEEEASGSKGPEVETQSAEAVGDKREELKPPAKTALDGVKVRVYLTDRKKIETVPLETYVMGVLAAEMPIDFHLEALKAQAVAARTYIVRRLSAGGSAGEADVLDTVQHQVYLSKDELAKRWKGEAKKDNLAKLKQAVEGTRGMIMTYEGEPIEAAFFSTSNGYTENSEDYWEQPLPYLRSVASPWDQEISPRYEAEVSFTLAKFYRAMGLSGKQAGSKPSMKVTKWTDGKRIAEVKINGKTFSGREVRESLGLASSHFSWKIGKDGIVFTTYGLGHGVGMSQWGANGMAREGKPAREILEHYYSGAKLEQASKIPNRTNS
ncbi:stage II sporulation protein D [Paenibacillus soyae]|uniref:Stage II sporulation protein D n=1 Tax=Paenibacillus soyae TaxID=2969249 RepID=A0A9X2N0D9_9BACL|nr:stage II sporulation protein D [Paenibacillus soyae]MCR2806772.1 stage II sporulation protein D [Paenibacillus soyae]